MLEENHSLTRQTPAGALHPIRPATWRDTVLCVEDRVYESSKPAMSEIEKCSPY